MALADDLDRILWTEDQIAGRVAELASQISGDFKHLSPPPVVVGVATGAFVFLADIVRKITLPVVVDFIRVESYGSGTESSGTPRISSDIKVDVSEKHVILVEDIVDTGNTLSCLIPHLEKKGASSVSVCTFLDKPARRRAQFQLVGDGKFYNGFECPDEFVVGYGMDFAERYRNLPCVGVLRQEIYKGMEEGIMENEKMRTHEDLKRTQSCIIMRTHSSQLRAYFMYMLSLKDCDVLLILVGWLSQFL